MCNYPKALDRMCSSLAQTDSSSRKSTRRHLSMVVFPILLHDSVVPRGHAHVTAYVVLATSPVSPRSSIVLQEEVMPIQC